MTPGKLPESEIYLLLIIQNQYFSPFGQRTRKTQYIKKKTQHIYSIKNKLNTILEIQFNIKMICLSVVLWKLPKI